MASSIVTPPTGSPAASSQSFREPKKDPVTECSWIVRISVVMISPLGVLTWREAYRVAACGYHAFMKLHSQLTRGAFAVAGAFMAGAGLVAVFASHASPTASQAPSGGVSATVVNCSGTRLVAGGHHPGLRRVATIQLINTGDEEVLFRLLVDGQGSAVPIDDETPQPFDLPAHSSTTTTYLTLMTMSEQACMGLSVQASAE